jgi:hypothetical protein
MRYVLSSEKQEREIEREILRQTIERIMVVSLAVVLDDNQAYNHSEADWLQIAVLT